MEMTITRPSVGSSLNTSAAGFPLVPTILDLDIAWDADRVVTGPNPSRATLDLWWPSWAAHRRPALHDRTFVDVSDGSRTVNAFAGLVDGITRRRRPADPYERSRRPADPFILTRTNRKFQPPHEPLEFVSIAWTQHGESVASMSIKSGDRWAMPATPPIGDDGLFDGSAPVVAVIKIDPLDIVAGALLYVMEIPERFRRASWHISVNGQMTPVTAGPVQLPSSTAGLVVELVSDPVWLDGDTSLPDLYAPAFIPVPEHRGIYPAGEFITVTGSDFLAGVERTKIGAEPWPAQTPSLRWTRIAQAGKTYGLPILYDVDSWIDYSDPQLRVDATQHGKLAPRDVDNTSAGELLTETLAGIGAAPISVEHGVVPWRAPRQARVLTPFGSISPDAELVTIPPAVVSDLPFSLDAGDVVNRITFTYLTPPDEPGESGELTERRHVVSFPASIGEHGEHSTTWSTTMLDELGAGALDVDVIGPLVDRLVNAVNVMSRPAYTFDAPIVLTPSRLAKIPPSIDVLSLLDTATRHGRLFTISHDLDGVPRDYALRGGSLVVEDGRLSLTLNPEPAGQSGAPGALLRLVKLYLPALTFDALAPNVTIDSTSTIGVLIPSDDEPGTKG